jgi:NADH:ubiquinone oxidoreductase subunit H
VIEQGCAVRGGSKLRNCIIMPGTEVAGSHENCIIGPDYELPLGEIEIQPSTHGAMKKDVGLAGPFPVAAAATVLIAPIALSTAVQTHASAYPMVMMILLGASSGFLTPVSHPVNVLVMGPGGYRFGNYAHAGSYLALIVFILAMMSMAIYGTFLAGFSSNNKYAFLGGLRASSQMISYEITMGATLVGLLMIFGTLDLAELNRAQGELLWGWLPKWGIILQPLGFLLRG